MYPLVPSVRLGKSLQERLDPRNIKVVHTVYSGYRDSLGDGDPCRGHIRSLGFEWVARFPSLYSTGNSDLNSPFEVERMTWFDDYR